MDNEHELGSYCSNNSQTTQGWQMREQFFEILAPAQWVVPAVFNSPHSGSFIPEAFLQQSRLSADALRQSEDCFVDELFAGCQSLGVPLLRALVSRSFIDLNREPYELDARMFMEDLPGYMNPGSPRVASGLGTIPKLVAEGIEIYRGKIHLSDAVNRIDQIYRPYHRTLTALLNECYNATAFALLVDCHSMPSSAVKAEHQPAIDIVLGDRFGAACNTEIASEVENLFVSEGFRVVRNRPYAGGFITETHGAPRHNRHALQIEVNRGLYMNEAKMEPRRDFADIRKSLTKVISALIAFLPQESETVQQKQAAE
jgi:N-formylglutamate amidohydrolase